MKDKKATYKTHKKHKSSKRASEKEYKAKRALKRDPGVPNLDVIKNSIVEEISRKKQTRERKVQLQNLLKRRPMSMQDYSNSATASTFYEEPEHSSTTSYKDSSRKSYFKDLLKVIESADIILEVLDARDPEGYRSSELENKVLSSGSKKLIIILNKIDLVPVAILKAWQEKISCTFPCVLFRSNTQEQNGHLSSASFHKNSLMTKAGQEMLETNKTLGTESLMNIIKNYMRSFEIKKAVTVGVVGYPNVGKSSVINSLRRARAVGVSSTPGFTKCIQEVEIESNIKILDCPGIVFDDKFDPDMVLRNVVKVDNVEDFIAPVERILQKVGAKKVQDIYGVEEFVDAYGFLGNLARRRGKLRKGGVTDLDAAGKIVLNDWVCGKIPYYVAPDDMMVD